MGGGQKEGNELQKAMIVLLVQRWRIEHAVQLSVNVGIVPFIIPLDSLSDQKKKQILQIMFGDQPVHAFQCHNTERIVRIERIA